MTAHVLQGALRVPPCLIVNDTIPHLGDVTMAVHAAVLIRSEKTEKSCPVKEQSCSSTVLLCVGVNRAVKVVATPLACCTLIGFSLAFSSASQAGLSPDSFHVRCPANLAPIITLTVSDWDCIRSAGRQHATDPRASPRFPLSLQNSGRP